MQPARDACSAWLLVPLGLGPSNPTGVSTGRTCTDAGQASPQAFQIAAPLAAPQIAWGALLPAVANGRRSSHGES